MDPKITAIYFESQLVKKLVSQLPWGHIVRVLQRINDQEIDISTSKGRMVVEYALRDLKKPTGVAGWETKLVDRLPELKRTLPVVVEIEAGLAEHPRNTPLAQRRNP